MNNLDLWKSNWERPFKALAHMQSDFEEMMKDLWANRGRNGISKFDFTPSCEVNEERDKYYFKFDLPGVAKEDVKIEIVGNQFTVTAERREEKKKEDRKTHLSELYYGSYTRTFTMPVAVDEKKVDAKFENGVLKVTIPKTEVQKTKQIAIN